MIWTLLGQLCSYDQIVVYHLVIHTQQFWLANTQAASGNGVFFIGLASNTLSVARQMLNVQ